MSSLSEKDANYLLFGYCKNIGKVLKDNLVPMDVIEICFAYYFVKESFYECGNNHIVFTNDDMTITNKEGEHDAGYGTFEIDCNDERNKYKIFKWTFLIHSNHSILSVSLGIDETKRKWVNSCADAEKGTIKYTYDGKRVYKLGHAHWSKGTVAAMFILWAVKL